MGKLACSGISENRQPSLEVATTTSAQRIQQITN